MGITAFTWVDLICLFQGEKRVCFYIFSAVKNEYAINKYPTNILWESTSYILNSRRWDACFQMLSFNQTYSMYISWNGCQTVLHLFNIFLGGLFNILCTVDLSERLFKKNPAMKDGIWTETNYHVVLNNPVSEVDRCKKRMFMSQRRVRDSVCYRLIHMENSRLKALYLRHYKGMYLQNNMAPLRMPPEVTAQWVYSR